MLVKFTENQMISTLIKKIKQKLKIENDIVLKRANDDEEDDLNPEQTATQAGLANNEELRLVELEKEDIEIRFANHGNEVVTMSFPRTTSTFSMYMQYAEQRKNQKP